MSTDAHTVEDDGTGEPAAPETEPTKPRFTLPSAYTILFALIVITALATWIIPAGRPHHEELSRNDLSRDLRTLQPQPPRRACQRHLLDDRNT